MIITRHAPSSPDRGTASCGPTGDPFLRGLLLERSNR
jgi:hypothetical protein